VIQLWASDLARDEVRALVAQYVEYDEAGEAWPRPMGNGALAQITHQRPAAMARPDQAGFCCGYPAKGLSNNVPENMRNPVSQTSKRSETPINAVPGGWMPCDVNRQVASGYVALRTRAYDRGIENPASTLICRGGDFLYPTKGRSHR
jgi:hypothetical protein